MVDEENATDKIVPHRYFNIKHCKAHTSLKYIKLFLEYHSATRSFLQNCILRYTLHLISKKGIFI